MRSCRRFVNRDSRAAGERSRIRGAASSIASGSPSNRWQISATNRPFASVSAKLGAGCLRSGHEEPDRRHPGELLNGRRLTWVGHGQWGNEHLVLAGEVQLATARGQDFQVRTGEEELGDEGSRREEMLEIVEDQEKRVASEPGDKIGEERPATSPMDVEAIGNRCRNERRVEHRGQRDERDPLRHRGAGPRRHGQGQPRFADPAWTGEGDQPHVVAREQTVDDRNLALPADQRVQRRRHVTHRRVDVRLRRSPGSRRSNVDVRREQVRHGDTRQRDVLGDSACHSSSSLLSGDQIARAHVTCQMPRDTSSALARMTSSKR